MTSNWEPLVRRKPLLAALYAAGLGLFFLFVALNRPTIANMRKIDLLHLLATGGLFGVAMVGVVLYLVARRKS